MMNCFDMKCGLMLGVEFVVVVCNVIIVLLIFIVDVVMIWG